MKIQYDREDDVLALELSHEKRIDHAEQVESIVLHVDETNQRCCWTSRTPAILWWMCCALHCERRRWMRERLSTMPLLGNQQSGRLAGRARRRDRELRHGHIVALRGCLNQRMFPSLAAKHAPAERHALEE
jgi:hypothetical protein